MFRLLTLLCFALIALMPQLGDSAEQITYRGKSFWVYEVDPKTEKLEIFLGTEEGKPNTFPALEQRIKSDGRRLKFAMNAGIFEGTFIPTGLHISEGKVISPLNLKNFIKEREGQFTPNFFLKPNGVFFVRQDGTADIFESTRYANSDEKPRLATQSGPLLVAAGKIHPVLEPDSTSERSRNGAGISADGKVILVCSALAPNEPAGRSNLYRFAELFRDRLNCPNALYLDGAISNIYIRGKTASIRESNWFAGILAIAEPANSEDTAP
tara:strand:+ start:1310 stop:2113 length:804 start_codon:yes stop_codon:yes gene_type:complete